MKGTFGLGGLAAALLLGAPLVSGVLLVPFLGLDTAWRGYSDFGSFRDRRSTVIGAFARGGLEGLRSLGARGVCVDTASGGKTFAQARPHAPPWQDGRIGLFLRYGNGVSEVFYAPTHAGGEPTRAGRQAAAILNAREGSGCFSLRQP